MPSPHHTGDGHDMSAEYAAFGLDAKPVKGTD